MSTTPTGTTRSADDAIAELQSRLSKYKPGSTPDRYARFCDDVLDVQRTHVQEQILESLDQHKQTVVVAANGVGKSYIAAAGGLAALYCNPDTIVNVTAGNKGTLKTNIWKPARSLFRNCDALPGRTLDSTREVRTELDDEWFFECISPRYPDDLEGPHNDHVIYIVEEADKPGVTADHIDSVRSTATDEGDRVLVICNPPRDESNVVYDLKESDQWNTLQFSSWDSHNVRIERGLEEGVKIPGLVETSKIKDDWDEFHNEPWPGLDAAMRAHKERDDLDTRWYRRRAGVMPPDGAQSPRPFVVEDVRQALDSPLQADPGSVLGVGYDVARMGGDSNVIGTIYENTAAIKEWSGTDHNQNETTVRSYVNGLQQNPPLAVDAVGEGSGVADRISEFYRSTRRFKNGQKAIDEESYYDRWTEGLVALGKRLPELRIDADSHLREELYTAARMIELNEKRRRSGDVVQATSKSELKDRLGRSPDRLDALVMAAWAADVQPQTIPEPGGTWYNPA